jgi:hypothetical protein
MEPNYSMYSAYHTTLRNIGLFTSVSLAVLSGSRNYDNNNIERYLLLLFSLIFLILSISINIFLLYDLKYYFHLKNELKKWILLSQFTLFFNILFFIYIFHLFFI